MATAPSITVNRNSRPHLTLITANGVGRATRVMLQGRPHLAVPVTSLLQGVLAGSRGALFYPAAEIAANIDQWNGKPLTISHPFDPITGRHLSANDEGVIQRQGVGFIGNTTWDGGKLRHLAYFDEARLKAKAPQVYNDLMKGRPVSVSTGLFTDNTGADPGASYNGRPYDAVARSYRADHLAVLVNGERGACDVTDGCGLLVNANPEGINQYTNEHSFKKDLLGHSTPEEREGKWTGFGTKAGQQLHAYQDSVNRKRHIYLAPAEIKELQDNGHLTTHKTPKITPKGREEMQKTEDAKKDDIDREAKEAGIKPIHNSFGAISVDPETGGGCSGGS